MTGASRGSYASRVALLVGCLAFAGALVAGSEAIRPDAGALAAAELAQAADEGAPLRLRPRRDLTAPVVPEQPEAESPAVPGVGPLQRTPRQIEVRDLGEVDPDALGTLDRSEGGLGWDMWHGTPRTLMERLLPRIPVAIHSPTLRDLVRRLLLTAAALPPAAEQGSALQGPAKMFTLRIEHLQSMGMIGPAAELLGLAPRPTDDLAVKRLRVDNMFLAHNLGAACSEVRDAGEHLVEVYWQEALVFCQLLAGDRAAARLGTQILADRNANAAFLALADRIGGNEKATVETLPSPSPLYLAMARSANVSLPKDTLDAASPAILRTIALSPNADTSVKLEAAERAASLGAIPSERLADIYASVEFREQDLENALTVASEWRDARGRALLYRAAQMHTVPAARAAVIQRALSLARDDGRLLPTVQLYRRQLSELPVSAELAWFAPDAARALLGMAERDAARPWISLLRQRAYRDADARNEFASIWALAILAGDEAVRIEDREGFVAWVEAVRGNGGALLDRAALGLALLEATGAAVPDAYWQHLVDGAGPQEGMEPPFALIPALRHAAAAGRRGETVLLAVLAMGAGDHIRPSLPIVYESIAALRNAGFIDEAHAIALELAVEAGL